MVGRWSYPLPLRTHLPTHPAPLPSTLTYTCTHAHTVCLKNATLAYTYCTQSRPPDLVGSWALDTSGWDGLTDIPVDVDGASDGMEDLGLSDLVVSFRKDGTVQIPVEKGVGLQWRVEPGPTHLDTIYFEMIPAAPKVCARGCVCGLIFFFFPLPLLAYSSSASPFPILLHYD